MRVCMRVLVDLCGLGSWHIGTCQPGYRVQSWSDSAKYLRIRILLPWERAQLINCLGGSAGIESGHENTQTLIYLHYKINTPRGKESGLVLLRFFLTSAPKLEQKGAKLKFTLVLNYATICLHLFLIHRLYGVHFMPQSYMKGDPMRLFCQTSALTRVTAVTGVITIRTVP